MQVICVPSAAQRCETSDIVYLGNKSPQTPLLISSLLRILPCSTHSSVLPLTHGALGATLLSPWPSNPKFIIIICLLAHWHILCATQEPNFTDTSESFFVDRGTGNHPHNRLFLAFIQQWNIWNSSTLSQTQKLPGLKAIWFSFFFFPLSPLLRVVASSFSGKGEGKPWYLIQPLWTRHPNSGLLF